MKSNIPTLLTILLLTLLTKNNFIAAQISHARLFTTNEVITKVPKNLQHFTPKGYKVINITKGNLNKDKFEDAIMVLSKNREEYLKDSGGPKRICLLLLGKSNGAFALVKRNDNAVPCIDCAGRMYEDPFKNIIIKDGYFSIENGVAGGIHYEHIVTFKYSEKHRDWYLYKDNGISYILNPSNDMDAEALIEGGRTFKTTKDFGTIKFQDYSWYQD